MKVSNPQRSFINANAVLADIFNNTYTGIAIVNLAGDWLKVNDCVCSIFRYSRWVRFNMTISNIIYADDRGVHMIHMRSS
jgi:hypothetical protein